MLPASAQTPLLSDTTAAAFSLTHGTYGNGWLYWTPGQPFPQAWQVNVTGTAPSPSSVCLTATTSASVAIGDVIVATFYYLRSDTTSDEVNISALFEQVGYPHADSIVIPLRGRGQWRKVSVPFIANANYSAGSARFSFWLSTQIQSLQISGVTLLNYGQKSLFGTGIIDATPQFVFSGSAAGTTFGTGTSAPVSGNPFFTTATHITVIADPHDDSLVKLSAIVPSAVTAGDTLVAIFWARDADAVAKNAVIGLTARQAVYPNTVVYNQSSLIVDGSWKQHIIPFAATTSYAANGMQFFLKCSAQLQTVEFGGLQLLDLGAAVPVSSLTSTVNDYPGRLITDSWRTDANTRIATYRKGNLTINVTGSSGSGIANASVTAAMQDHLFGFGSAVKADELTTVSGTDADTYRTNVQSLFNKAVFENDMKWVQWETVSGTNKVKNAIGWLMSHGVLNIRGHNLVWPSWTYCPGDLPGLTGTALTGRVFSHIDNESGYFKIKSNMRDWDVVNEPYTNHSLMDKINGISSGRGTVAQDAAVIQTWLSRTANDDTFPNCFLNDAGVTEIPTHIDHSREDYNYNLLSTLIANGAPVDGFGFESHFTAATPPLTVKAIFDRFAALGIKGQVTEFDQNTPDQILQADYLADYMTMAFSEPNFDSFLMWGFWDTLHWLGNAPLYTANWTLKPSGEAWKGLVYGKWWTNTSAVANGSGVATVNGFLGRYALTGSNAGIAKTYYADLPLATGATINLKLSGTAGTSHVWLHGTDRSVLYSPLTVASDATAYDGFCVTSGTGTGNNTSPTSGLMRIDSEATGTVNIWMRVIAPNSSSDAFWILVDGGTWQNFTVTQGASWHWVLWGQATLAAGTTHPIYFADADGGTKMDQVLVTDDLSFIP